MRRITVIGLFAVVAASGSLLGNCASGQNPLVTAEKGLRIACAGLAEAVAQGTEVPAGELVARACDVDRTKHLMQVIVKQLAPAKSDLDLAPLDPQVWEASPEAFSDAGAH